MYNKLLRYFKYFFPAKKEEYWVGGLFFVVFSLLGIYLSYTSSIIYHPFVPWDAYWSFDNRAIIQTGGGAERHPLSEWLFSGLKSLALFLSGDLYDAKFRCFYAVVSSLLVSLSCVQVFRYVRQIIHFGIWTAVMIVLFFAGSSTVIMLSFSPETYVWSLYFLLVYLNYVSEKWKSHAEPSVMGMSVFATVLGGITITNIIKVFLPSLFVKGVFKKISVFGGAFRKTITSLLCFLLLIGIRFYPNFSVLWEKGGEQYEKFARVRFYSFYELVFHWFFGANVLFPDFVVKDYQSKTGYPYKAIFPDIFHSSLSIFFISILILLLLFGVYLAGRNKYVGLIISLFAVDVLLHVVLRFGLDGSFVYGGHFVFVYPFLLAWTIQWVQKKIPEYSSGILLGVGILLVYVLINNISGLLDFIGLAQNYYPV